jgi:hypothetical protein
MGRGGADSGLAKRALSAIMDETQRLGGAQRNYRIIPAIVTGWTP